MNKEEKIEELARTVVADALTAPDKIGEVIDAVKNAKLPPSFKAAVLERVAQIAKEVADDTEKLPEQPAGA